MPKSSFLSLLIWSTACCHLVKSFLLISRCPTFQNLPRECHMQDNPKDPCCQQPACVPSANGSLSSVPVPSYGKGFTGYGPPRTPVIGTGGTGGGFTGNGSVTVNPNIPHPTGFTGAGSMYQFCFCSVPVFFAAVMIVKGIIMHR